VKNSSPPDVAGSSASARAGNNCFSVALLTGGSDRPYVFGLMTALLSKNVTLDLMGSDELNTPEFNGRAGVNFLHLRGDQRSNAGFAIKATRILVFYARLFRYVASAKPSVFHILWNNRFEHFDRTLLMLYYKLLGKRIVLTVHNVNTAKRDRTDSWLNRFTLRFQYRLADHIFVHTLLMKSELLRDYGVDEGAVTVIPFGINNSIPTTALTSREAKARLGCRDGDKTLLCFGRMAPYKGLEFLIDAVGQLASKHPELRLVIAGRPDHSPEYSRRIAELCAPMVREGRILLRSEHIPEGEIEIFFKAADVSVLPYKQIYQSGVLFLSYSFGLPVLAADVGALSEEIVEGRTGFVFRPEDPAALAQAIERYFASDLFAELAGRRREIIDYATAKHSWDVVAQATLSVYAGLLGRPLQDLSKQDASNASLDLHASS